MARTRLITRLARRDLRRRPVEAILVLLAVTAAMATLTLGLVVRGVATGASYDQTRAATAGPDVVATNVSAARLTGVVAQARKAGAIAIGGPYPVAAAVIRANGYTAGVTAEGRDPAPGAVDRPAVTTGTWVRPGGVVVERSFALALGLRVGQTVTLNGHAYRVTGIAVTAASPPYPETGFLATPSGVGDEPGLVWLPRSAAAGLASRARPLTYTVDVRTPDPAALAGPMGFSGPWTSAQAIAAQDAKVVSNERLVLDIGGWLLSLLAVASVGVLVGGRLAEQTRRVGLLKAVGGTPGLVAATLLAEYLGLALGAAAIGLVIGRLTAPLLTRFSFFAGLSSQPARPALTLPTVGVVVGVAVAVAAVSTLVPAWRAARTPTVTALADAARPPKRRALATRVSARLPVPLLLGLRLAVRRPRRSLLNAVTVAITVTTVITVLIYHASKGQPPAGVAVVAGAPSANPVSQVMSVLVVVLVILAAINAIFTAWATVLDDRYPAALARALGTSSGQLTAGLSASQLLPAVPGAILGVPLGIGLYAAVSGGGTVTFPPAAWVVAVILAVLAAVVLLTAIPARLAARHPVVTALASKTA